MTQWIVQFIEQGGYAGIALLMALENIFPPIPSEVIMGLAGIEAGQGGFTLWLVVLWGTFGTVIGNCPWFWLGRRITHRQMEAFVDRHGRWITLSRKDLAAVSRFFHRHGSAAVLIGRMMPAGRTIISVPAGLFDMSWPRFLILTTIGSAGWNFLLAGTGFWLGRQFEKIDAITGPLATAGLVAMLLVWAWRVVTWPSKQAAQERQSAD